jgi:hypothetical protein
MCATGSECPQAFFSADDSLLLQEARARTHARTHTFLSTISGTGAAIWSKTNLALLATITFEVGPFCAYAPFPALLSFLNASWKLFCEGLQ